MSVMTFDVPAPARKPTVPSPTRDLQDRLLALLNQYAETGRQCPSLVDLAATLGINRYGVSPILEALKRRGEISWRMHRKGNAWLGRTVTIAATGKVTAMPQPPTNSHAWQPPFTPGELGCRVRDLRREAPAEFRYYKQLYEAREAERHAAAQREYGVFT